MSLSRAHRLVPYFAAVSLAVSGWISARAGNDNPSASQSASQTQPAKAGKVGIHDFTKVDTSLESERKFLAALPVSASKDRVAVLVYVPPALSLFDKQLLLAAKTAATEYATETGRNVPFILMPDQDNDAETMDVDVWVGGSFYMGMVNTFKDKEKTDTMTSESYHQKRLLLGKLMKDGWQQYQERQLSQVVSSSSQVAGLDAK